MDVLQDQNIDLQAAIDSNVQVEALTNKIHELDGVISAYDSALDEIASIVGSDSDNALDEVLSFISSLDLSI